VSQNSPVLLQDKLNSRSHFKTGANTGQCERGSGRLDARAMPENKTEDKKWKIEATVKLKPVPTRQV